ncbi:MAG: hypothetical protein IT435_10915 [Phycisphaerales bacterium]|nr:hypothetical protein [Phycisphaerales bacterium]
MAMLEGRQRHDWSLASSMMAVFANAHRDPKRSRLLRPSDFDPFAKRARPVKTDVSVLKDVFIDRRMPSVASEVAP